MIIFLYGPDDYRRSQKKRDLTAEFLKKRSEQGIGVFDLMEGGALLRFDEFLENQQLFESAKFAIVENAFEIAAAKFAKIDETALARIDAAVAAHEARSLRFDGWATPGANLHAAALEVARATARRAERRLVALPAHGRSVRPVVRQYVNRLCDLLWLMARAAEPGKGAAATGGDAGSVAPP